MGSRKLRPFYIGTAAVIGIALLGIVFVPRAHAEVWDRKTLVTVNQPFIFGDKVLGPGTYVWKVLGARENGNLVQVWDKDEKVLESASWAVPNHRLKPIGSTHLTFWEPPEGVPRPVRAWFYPGDRFGAEFAYPEKAVHRLMSRSVRAIPPPVTTVVAPSSARETWFGAQSSTRLMGLSGLGLLSMAGLISLLAPRQAAPPRSIL